MSEFYGIIVPDNELYHHGVLGMRWGVRRFQPYPKGHKGGKFLGKIKQRKQAKIRKKNLKKAREKAAENRKLAADKERVLSSGSAREVQKYKGKISNEELGRAVKRLELESKLDDYAKKEIKTGMEKIDNAMKSLDKITNWTNTGTKAWNQVVDVYNTTPEGRRKPLRKIGGNQPPQRGNT